MINVSGNNDQEKWNYKNISIINGVPEKNKTYEVTNDINVRDSAPTFSLFEFGYKFGNLIGNVVSGEKIKILKVEEVGFDKIWAKIALVN